MQRQGPWGFTSFSIDSVGAKHSETLEAGTWFQPPLQPSPGLHQRDPCLSPKPFGSRGCKPSRRAVVAVAFRWRAVQTSLAARPLHIGFSPSCQLRLVMLRTSSGRIRASASLGQSSVLNIYCCLACNRFSKMVRRLNACLRAPNQLGTRDAPCSHRQT